MSSAEVATYAEVPDYDRWNYCYNEGLRKQFLDWLDRTGNSPKIAANMLEWPVEDVESYISKRLAVGKDPELEKQIADLLERQKPSDLLSKDAVAATSVFKSGWECLQVCMEAVFTLYLEGESGIGKSTILGAFKKQYPDTILVTLDTTRRGFRDVFRLIGQSLGCQFWQGERSMSFYLDKIVERLEGWPAPLIVDDIRFAKFEVLEGLRRVYDITGISVVVVGQPGFFFEMRSQRKGFPLDQIVSRFNIKRFLGKEIPEGDVRLITDLICPGLDKKCIRFLHRITLGEGKFRALRDTLKVAQKIAQIEGRKITLELLKGAHGLREF